MITKPIKDYENLYTINSNGEIFSLDRIIVGTDSVNYPKKGKKINVKVNCKNGYFQVALWKDNKGKLYSIHRLLAQAFIPNPLNKPQVNHIDGNKLNNSLSNLEWVTVSENSVHALKTGLVVRYKKFTDLEYETFLHEFLSELNLTEIAKKYDSSLTSFSYWIKEAAIRLNLLEEYICRLKYYKSLRAEASGILMQEEVEQYSLSGEFIQSFPSFTMAAKSLGKESSGPISNCISGRTKSGYGFVWKRK